MIYESDRNMPLSTVRNSYEWENELELQDRACHAITMQNPDLLRSAIKAGANIHHPIRPLLVEAARKNKYTAVTHLLELGADVNFPNNSGVTAMAGAAKCGNSSLVELLFQSRAETNPCDRWGTTPLMEAVYHGHFNCMRFLVHHSADVNAENDEGLSVLAHVRHGRAAWEYLRTRSHREWRDVRAHRLLESSEVRERSEEDFACVQALDQLYQEIGTFLIDFGATDCGTPIPFLTFPKKKKTGRIAA